MSHQAPGKRGPKPSADRRAVAPRVKATFYLEPVDLAALEKERDRRRSTTGRRRGVDLSALVREAIRLAFGRGR